MESSWSPPRKVTAVKIVVNPGAEPRMIVSTISRTPPMKLTDAMMAPMIVLSRRGNVENPVSPSRANLIYFHVLHFVVPDCRSATSYGNAIFLKPISAKYPLL